MKYTDWHNHTHYSNLIFRDSTNKTTDLIDKAIELGHGGVGITDHGVISSHVEAIQHMKELKQDDPSLDFKLGLGCELYLVHREEVDKARENQLYTRFYHFIVIAKNRRGYEILKELSSRGWYNSFVYKNVMRTPIYYEDLIEILKNNKGDLVASSACLGSELSHLVLDAANELDAGGKESTGFKEAHIKILNHLKLMKNLFGDDYYIELQPSHSTDQVKYNSLVLRYAKLTGIKPIITTDSHYLRPENRLTHTAFLKAQEAERETDSFYATTYLMTIDEIRSYCEYMEEEEFAACINNTEEIRNKIEEFDLYDSTKVPNAKTIKFDKDYISTIDLYTTEKYDYIRKFIFSEHEIDKILIQQIDLGMKRKQLDYNEFHMERINKELGSLWEISVKLNQQLSSYYILTKEIVEIIWKVSLVGVSRGSAGAFFICYLLDITQINPLDYNLPDWRHISKERPELPDIDVDSQAGERANIIENIKNVYGADRVLNIATFKTEGTSSAIQTIARGMNIPIDDARYLSSLAVKEGTSFLSIKKCRDNYNTNPKCKKFINALKEMDQEYEGFYENVCSIEGLICGRSIHASGVYIFPVDYVHMNALMKAPNGQEITQFSMKDSDYMGGLKVDLLTIEALDRIRKDMELLIKHNVIEDKGSLKATYDAYLHPTKLEYEDPDMWQLLYDGEITNAFQMETLVGRTAVQKVQPHKLQEIIATNSLMRLSCDGEQPIDRFVKHKKDITLWYDEMHKWGLNEDEIHVLEKHLLKSYGVANTQEDLMRLAMDEKIANFTLLEANKLRKAIAKAKAKNMIEPIMNLFVKKGLENGNRMKLLAYVWEIQVKPSYGYAFSEPHVAAYSIILLQEMNLVYKFGALYWKTACLSINSGNINEETNKNSDYGAIAKAIGNMPKGFVLPPDINKAGMEFEAMPDQNKAMYSLNAILTLGEDICKYIIQNRPYTSFEDFLDKCFYTKIVPQTKIINLIKAGSFEGIDGNKYKTMIKFINIVCPPNEKSLTTANIPKLYEYKLIPDKFYEQVELYYFRKTVFNKKNRVKDINKSTGLYLIPDKCIKVFENKYSIIFSESMEVLEEGICLNNKKFDKIYNSKIEVFKKWLAEDKTKLSLNNYEKKLLWNKYCSGSLEKWDMDSICYYHDQHELDFIPISKYFNIVNFNTLPTEPVIQEVVRKKKYTYNKYELHTISGTVVEKDKNHYTINVLTQFGVVDVKLGAGQYAYYDRKIGNEESWLKRGNKLVIVGYRMGQTFYPKKYNDSTYAHTIMKIDKYNSEAILFRTTRESE